MYDYPDSKIVNYSMIMNSKFCFHYYTIEKEFEINIVHNSSKYIIDTI